MEMLTRMKNLIMQILTLGGMAYQQRKKSEFIDN